MAVQFSTMRMAGDGTPHLLFQTTGEGTAIVFQDGVAVEGSWRRPDSASRTRFYDAEGKEIAFNRGTTWVEIVPSVNSVAY